MAATGGTAETIPIRVPGGSQAGRLLSPSVSPDGRWLAGQSNEHDSVDTLAVRLDGSEPAR